MTVNSQRFCGVHAATVCPMKPDFSIDEAALACHVASVARTSGVEGLLINGHAGENFVLTREELHPHVRQVDASSLRSVDTYITRLRHKLNQSTAFTIETIQRVGYRCEGATPPDVFLG